VADSDLVPEQDLPRTRESLAADLRTLGVRAGSVLLLHSSVKALGWVCGGPVAVVQALCDSLGADGTLVVPTHTPDNSDPAGWQHPPVPQSWWPIIRAHMPGFDAMLTPSRWMGAIAEAVRTWPGARRSDHPHTSFAALGRAADEIVAGHRLDDMLGDTSPLGRVYDLFPLLRELRAKGGSGLSGGEQKLLAVGRALMGNPVLLILDEPSEGLGPLLVRTLVETIRRAEAAPAPPLIAAGTSKARS